MSNQVDDSNGEDPDDPIFDDSIEEEFCGDCEQPLSYCECTLEDDELEPPERELPGEEP